MTRQRTREILAQLAARPGHDEVKSAFSELLIEEFGVERQAISFEHRVPEVRGRLDALIGRTVLEAKRNLTAEWGDVERRMPDYLADRERETGERFVGVATDGLKWVVFERRNTQLEKIKETILDPAKAEQFLAWLDGAIALRASLPPDPLTVRLELGKESVAYRRAHEKLSAVWLRIKDQPAMALKRQLWQQLLSLVYGRSIEADTLWFQHTFLVIVAKAIAQAVLGLRDDDPARLLSGAAFRDANIHAAVESDFFDWPLCWRPCRQGRSSNSGDGGCAGPGGIASGSTYTYAGPHEPSRPLQRGRIMGLRDTWRSQCRESCCAPSAAAPARPIR